MSNSLTITLKENNFLNERMHDPERTKISTIMWMCGSLNPTWGHLYGRQSLKNPSGEKIKHGHGIDQ